MVTTIHIAMTEAPSLLLHQWLSPAFPVGAFAYSSGLETAIVEDHVTSGHTLQAWLEDLCTHGPLASDLVLLSAAYQETQPLEEIDQTARAFCPSAERLQETDLLGAAFVDTVNAVWSLDLPRLTYAVAVAAAARAKSIPLDLTARLFLQAALANLISVAVRLVPLGQTEGQTILAALSPLIETTAAKAIATPLEAISSASFAADIAAMRHETLQTRIFRT